MVGVTRVVAVTRAAGVGDDGESGGVGGGGGRDDG